MDKFTELAERVERAEGPDRNLDAMIHHAVKDGTGVGYAADAPAYCASLDDAMSLVNTIPELVSVETQTTASSWARVSWMRDGFNPTSQALAAELPLALTAAALKALATKESDHDTA